VIGGTANEFRRLSLSAVGEMRCAPSVLDERDTMQVASVTSVAAGPSSVERDRWPAVLSTHSCRPAAGCCLHSRLGSPVTIIPLLPASQGGNGAALAVPIPSPASTAPEASSQVASRLNARVISPLDPRSRRCAISISMDRTVTLAWSRQIGQWMNIAVLEPVSVDWDRPRRSWAAPFDQDRHVRGRVVRCHTGAGRFRIPSRVARP
jgi:hypothetical protein